ncbi:GT2 family glycosyltransferase [Saccharothrix saharensis]|uniref:GT2 family glycosyltransferase n=1 Tax=Saccharothrix saharensis TaxID=571190 RepID=A0A543JGB8_9PSEU|nr:glycosyltransferase [Saccharothrix saharensis]TQM81889.1 GT2 family glycosyltransferase [Saccharothrix saharensis]
MTDAAYEVETPPLVSIVLVSYGGRAMLNHCLYLVEQHTTVPHEVIVVDSGSPDGTDRWVRDHLRNARGHVVNRNIGFGAGCNLGVLDARAPYICFLNADVEVGPRWLEPLIEVLDRQPSVGAVAPLMRDQSGAVQEFGSVVDADGWCRAWGDGAPLGPEEALFPHAVDYASAACLLVRRRAFHQVGGFSTDYDTAYFEDVDLAFGLRAAGWSTVVEPKSTVVHQRHGSSNSEVANDLMKVNHSTFLRRWGAELAGRPALPAPDRPSPRFYLARDVLVDERVLVVDDRVPNADRGSGDPRTQRMLEALAAPNRRITLLARDLMRAAEYAPALLEQGIEVVWVHANPFQVLRERAGLYDVVIAARPHNFQWIADAVAESQPQAVKVYDSESLFHRRMDQYVEHAESPVERTRLAVEAAEQRAVEEAAFRWADIGICVTEQEAEWARGVAPDTAVKVVGYPADRPGHVPGVESRTGIAYFGGFMAGPGSPNEIAVLDLVRDVLPPLLARHPDLRLGVVGADPTPAVKALASPHVEIVGRVPNPAWVLGRYRLQVVPMRLGTGIKLKFLDSMAAGLPFVTTSVGAEGLHLGDLAKYLVADSTAELADRVDALLTDDELWLDVQRELLRIADERFSWSAFRRELDEVLAEAGIAPPPRER